jgi:uncharacterized protein
VTILEIKLLDIRMNAQHISEVIVPLLKQHRVCKAGLFGSFASSQAGDDSDVDILVEVDKNTSLLDFIHIKLSLEDALGRPVDLVEYQSIKPKLRDNILSQEIRLYG